MFTCKRCGYIANFKCNLKSHYNRKKICQPMKSNISIETLRNDFNGDVNICKPNVNIFTSDQKKMSTECKPNVNTCSNVNDSSFGLKSLRSSSFNCCQ